MTEVTPRPWVLPAGHALGPQLGDLRWHHGPCHPTCGGALLWWTAVYRQRLNRKFTPVAVWGGTVQAAVVHVQQLAGLPTTGVLGPEVWEAVRTVQRPKPVPREKWKDPQAHTKPKWSRAGRGQYEKWHYWRRYSQYGIEYGTTPDAPPWWPGRPFGPHEKGWHVSVLQEKLGVKPTGCMNPGTVKRVRGWQRLRGWPVTGIVDVNMACELDPGPYEDDAA